MARTVDTGTNQPLCSVADHAGFHRLTSATG